MNRRLLVMASLFYPQKNGGGPIISIKNVVDQLKNDYEITVISKNHEINQKMPLAGIKNGWNDMDFGKAYYFPYGQHRIISVLSIIKKINPDIIYQNSFFSFDDVIPVFLYKRYFNTKVKIVIAPRGEFYPKRLQTGRTKKLLYVSLLRSLGLLSKVCFQGTGEEECRYINSFLGVKQEQIYDISNITFVNKNNLRIIEKKTGELRLVYIARIHPTKNLLGAITYLKGVKGSITFDIWGAIEDERYWNQCMKEISEFPPEIKVTYKGTLQHDLVCKTISEYHVYYMPTLGENYGHSIVEALMSERPVIISDQTPWTDLNEMAGRALPLEESEKFTEAVQAFCDMDNKTFAFVCKNAGCYIDKKLNIAETVQKYKDAFS